MTQKSRTDACLESASSSSIETKQQSSTSTETKLYSGESIEGNQHNTLPVPSTHTTRTYALIGLALSWVLAIFLFCFGIAISSKGYEKHGATCTEADVIIYHGKSQIVNALISLVATIIFALAEAGLGYPHSVALRWCLWNENRLSFNTNTRLLTASRTSFPNGRFMNGVYFFGIVLSYSASSQPTYASPSSNGYWDTRVGGITLLVLGGGLLIQAALSTASVYSARKYIRSWSSDPLHNALSRLGPDLHRSEGRCMMSVWDIPLSVPSATPPKTRQRAMITTSRSVKGLVAVIWCMPVLTLIWVIVVMLVMKIALLPAYGTRNFPYQNPFIVKFFEYLPPKTQTHEVSSEGGVSTSFPMDTFFGGRSAFALTIVTYACIQSYLTMGLHCAEAIFNKSRDEDSWRRTTSRKGKRLSDDSVKRATTSWKTILLFVLKVLCHFVFGRSLVPNYYEISGGYGDEPCISPGLSVIWSPLWILFGLTLILAVVSTILARRAPRGPQPSTWGHHQTIVDLVDDWGKPGQPLHWGDKGPIGNSVARRHAGTSNGQYSLGRIDFNALYGGVEDRC